MNNPFQLAGCIFLLLSLTPPFIYHSYHVWTNSDRNDKSVLTGVASALILSLAITGIIIFILG